MATKTWDRSLSIKDSPVTQALFNSPKLAWIWLAVRLYMAYTWITAGWEKLNSPAWVKTGTALQGFWKSAVAIPAAPGKPMITFGWYRVFLQVLLNSGSYTWFAKMIAVGELLIGLGLVFGAFTGIAAAFGAFMNWNFMMAGSASVNPMFFLLGILLVLAWKTAGYWGLDRWLLPLVGTPWQRGEALAKPAVPVDQVTA